MGIYTTWGFAAIWITARFLIGSVVGLIVAALIYRFAFGVGLAVRGALLGGIAFLLVSGIAGWAGSHGAFENGRRIDTSPWGEDLRLRNFIAENELTLCFSTSFIAALLAGFHFQTTKSKR
jgi:hypothetical protein